MTHTESRKSQQKAHMTHCKSRNLKDLSGLASVSVAIAYKKSCHKRHRGTTAPCSRGHQARRVHASNAGQRLRLGVKPGLVDDYPEVRHWGQIVNLDCMFPYAQLQR